MLLLLLLLFMSREWIGVAFIKHANTNSSPYHKNIMNEKKRQNFMNKTYTGMIPCHEGWHRIKSNVIKEKANVNMRKWKKWKYHKYPLSTNCPFSPTNPMFCVRTFILFLWKGYHRCKYDTEDVITNSFQHQDDSKPAINYKPNALSSGPLFISPDVHPRASFDHGD